MAHRNILLFAGVGVLLFAVWRLALRFGRGVPAAPTGESAVQALLAKATHGILYVLMLAVPAVGLFFALRCYCEAQGRPLPVTVISLSGLALNVAANHVVIHGSASVPWLQALLPAGQEIPAMGGPGCGWATALVMWILSLILLAYVLSFVNVGLYWNNHHHMFQAVKHIGGWVLWANLHLLFGDGMLGFAQGAPYAAIIAAAGGEAIPQAWIDQLAVGGRLVAPAVTGVGQQHLVVIDKTAHGVKKTVLEPVLFVPLKSGVA